MESTDCGWSDALAVRMLRCWLLLLLSCSTATIPLLLGHVWTDKIPAWNGRKCCTPSIAKHFHRLYSRGNLRIFIFWVNFSRCKAANQLHHFGSGNVEALRLLLLSHPSLKHGSNLKDGSLNGSNAVLPPTLTLLRHLPRHSMHSCLLKVRPTILGHCALRSNEFANCNGRSCRLFSWSM